MILQRVQPPTEAEPKKAESRLYAIPDGHAGIAVTLDRMVELTKEYRVNIIIRRLAEQIISPVPAKSWYNEIQAIQQWVRRHIRYTEDVADVEMLKTPVALLETPFGDCDDMSLLAGTLLSSIGKAVRYVAVSTNDPYNYEHVYVEVKIGPRNDARWIGVETTEDVPLGWTPQPQRLRMVRHV